MAQAFPPGPKSFIPGLQLLEFRRDPISFLMRVAREFGDIAHFRAGPQHYFLLNQPDHIRDIFVANYRSFRKGRMLERAKRLLGEGLLTSEGEFHQRQRRLAQPAFHRDRVARYARIMVEYANRLQCERWRDGQTLDIAKEMMHVTLAIVGKTLFDTETESQAEEVQQALSQSMERVGDFMMPFADFLDKLPLPANRRFLEARGHLDSIVYRFINERRRSGEDRGDLLSMLIAAQDPQSDGGDGARMTDLQLRDQAITIFLAGHETTSNALTWTWYLLSQHPDVEARVHAELDSVLKGRLPAFDDVQQLRYTEMVILESLRLYPPVWMTGRRALEDYRLGEWIAPAGSFIMMCQYVTHHDPRFFPDPSRFSPERWTPEARASRPQFSYFPFGGGPRRCVGEGFAMMEAILVLATLAQKWSMRREPGPPVALLPLITLRPKDGMRMILSSRTTPQANQAASS